MNPDPNQPQEPVGQSAPEVTPVPYPVEPITQPTLEVSVPVETPVDGAPAPNPFSAGPIVGSDLMTMSPFPAGEPLDSAPAMSGTDPIAAPAKSKKKLVILISAIVGGLIILAGAALAVYFLLFSVTKADYQKAYDQVSTVRDKYSSDDNITSGSSKETVDAAKTSYADFKTENAKLADLKVFKVDKDLKTKYDTYATKAKAYITYADAFFPALDRFVGANDQISALGDSSSSFTSANVQKMIDIYKGVDDINDPILKPFIDSTIAAYQEILPQLATYESKTATAAQKNAAISVISDTSSKITAAATTLSDALDAKGKSISLNDELNVLGQATTAKLNASK